MERMRDQAIVCNIGHFDNEIQMARARKLSGHREDRNQAAGRQVHVPRRPLDFRAGRRPSGKPRAARRAIPSFVMTQLVHEPDASRRSNCGHEKTGRRASTACRSISTRRWRGCTWTIWASRLTQPDPQAGRLHRRPGRRSLQGRFLPVLSHGPSRAPTGEGGAAAVRKASPGSNDDPGEALLIGTRRFCLPRSREPSPRNSVPAERRPAQECRLTDPRRPGIAQRRTHSSAIRAYSRQAAPPSTAPSPSVQRTAPRKKRSGIQRNERILRPEPKSPPSDPGSGKLRPAHAEFLPAPHSYHRIGSRPMLCRYSFARLKWRQPKNPR